MSPTWTCAKHLGLSPTISWSPHWRDVDLITWQSGDWLDGCTPRVVVNGSVSRWRPVMSGVPQGLVFRPALFDTFIGIMDLSPGLSALSASLRPKKSKLSGGVGFFGGIFFFLNERY